MRCTNCQFHNMPGSNVCGRCGTSLGLAGASDIDVHPPRAGAAALALRRVVPYRQWWAFLRDETVGGQVRRIRRALWPEQDGLPGFVAPEDLMLRAIVPGWPQWYARQRWQGAIFFLSYATLMIWGVLATFGARAEGGVVLGLAFAVHAMSWVDVTFQSWQGDTLIVRFARSLITSFMLILILYAPPMWLVQRYASPSRIGYAAGALAEGEVVLVNSAARPAVGDVAIFHIRFNADRQEGRRHVIIRGFDGAMIDRVLAGPGDRVVCRGGAITVNGRIPSIFPLNPAYRPADVDVQVPPGAFFILPSNLPGGVASDRDRPAALAEMSVVRAPEISGVVWYRVSPASRRGRL